VGGGAGAGVTAVAGESATAGRSDSLGAGGDITVTGLAAGTGADGGTAVGTDGLPTVTCSCREMPATTNRTAAAAPTITHGGMGRRRGEEGASSGVWHRGH